jgi:hypothetical protein
MKDMINAIGVVTMGGGFIYACIKPSLVFIPIIGIVLCFLSGAVR